MIGKDPVLPEDALIWFTDGSKTDSGTGSGISGIRLKRSFSFPLGKYATVFQTEIYAILQCACENIRRAYKHKWIFISFDSQAELRALNSPKVISGLVAECLDALSALACLNEGTLIWVPGHCGIPGNEEADSLLVKCQLYCYLVQSRLLEYLGVQQEMQLRTGLSVNITTPGETCQDIDMAKSS
jgi:ribonuclease HI